MIIILIESLFMLHIPIDLLKTFLVTKNNTKFVYQELLNLNMCYSPQNLVINY